MKFATISEGQVLDFTVLNNIISNQKELNSLVNSLTNGLPSSAGISDVTQTVIDKIYYEVAVPWGRGDVDVACPFPAPWAGRVVGAPVLVASIRAWWGSPGQNVNVSLREVSRTGCIAHVFPNNVTTAMTAAISIVGFAEVTVQDAN